ncbi:LPXTG cell wall anchor domain-containing protein [Enterococcus dongliensis]
MNRIVKFLPKTGMENSSLIWLGLGITNVIAAVYLLRKK